MRRAAAQLAGLMLSLAVVVTSAAVAQETTGAVIGTVTSQDGAPLAGAALRLEDADKGLERTAATGSDGRYRLMALPPSRYLLTVSRPGFQTVSRWIRVELGRTVTNPIELPLGAVAETIEVTGAAPLVDVTSTVGGLSVTADELLGNLPVHREVTQIALLAPGTFAGVDYWQQASYTGLYTPGQGVASFSGSSFGENSFVMNGLSVTNFRNFMGSSFVPLEFVDEVQIKTGGYEAEFGRATGGVVNMVTKSGSNQFRGGASAYWEPESLREQDPDTALEANQEESRESFELNASLGGPILRDHVFFFAFVRYSDASWTDIYTDTADRHQYATPYWGGKVDWNLTASHRLEATFLSDSVEVDFARSNYGFDDREWLDVRATGVRSRGGDNLMLAYTGVLDDSFLLTAAAGRNEFNRTSASTGDGCPYVRDNRGDVVSQPGCWGRSVRGVDWDRRDAVRLDADWFLGDHSLRVGADYEFSESYARQDYSGGVAYRYSLNGSEDQDPEEYRYPDLPWDQDLVEINVYRYGGSYDLNSSAAYAQDSWTPTPQVTINYGLRWERYENMNNRGETFIETDDQLAPRVGAIWDPSGRGRSKLYGGFGVYHLPVASVVNIRHASGVLFTEEWHTFDGALAADGSPSSLGEQLGDTIVWQSGVTPDPKAVIAEDLDPMSQSEVIVGYEHMVGSNWSLGVRGVARWYGEVIEDFTIDQGLWRAYGVECLDPALLGTSGYCYDSGWRLGNPGTDFRGWYDLDGDGELDPVVVSAGDLGYPEAERNHWAVELTVSRRFADGWMLQGSYTWSHTYGNYEGTISSEGPNDLAGMNEKFDYPYMMEHGWGDLATDRAHNLKLYGAYSFDVGLQVGANLFFMTGHPRNSWGRHPTDPWASTTNYFSFYTDGQPRPRGSGGLTENLWGVDLMLRYAVSVAGADANLRLDVFNILDRHGVDWYWDWMERPQNGTTHGYAGEPVYFQPPRSVRLGVGLTF
jgi:outer membrane receptor protein involved in Fe transport